MYAAEPAVHRIIEFAKQLEGVARNASTHAAGVVISREPLTELMPLQKATNSDATMTQFEMHGVEALGLLKFDFLGLSNLTILRQAVDLIRQHRGVEIDLDKIPLDDARTFELLASGETTGVFQLESAGMRRYVRELQPTSVFDLAAMVALYRPGPMDNIPHYIARKHGQETVTYLHPLLEPYLERTYGIFVYQEDIMAAAVGLAGFTGPEADTLGYAIRKKKSAVLHSLKDKFVTQAAERGVRPDTIDAVFKAFEPFERYGFNKAHATCYGLVAYQTAYLKANYTVEYMTSVLTAFRDTAEKVAAAVAECRRMGISVLPPDVHASHLEFTVEGASIRFGLLAVKNVGQGAIESIIAAREGGGPFRSFADFCNRIDLRLVNKRVLESLVKVGALSAFGHPGRLLDALDDTLAMAQADQRERASGQISFFDLAAEPAALEAPLADAPEVPTRERLRWEKELLGLYLSDHPLGEVAEQIGQFVSAYSSDLKDESLDGQRVVVGGVVTGSRTVVTKAKATMAVVTLEDLQGAIEVVVFPRLYEQTAGTWQDGVILLVAGRIDHRGEEVSLLADAAWEWDAAVARGEAAFAAEVDAGDRASRGRGRGGARGAGPDGRPFGAGNGSGSGNAHQSRADRNGGGPSSPAPALGRAGSAVRSGSRDGRPSRAPARVVGARRPGSGRAGLRGAAAAGGGASTGGRVRRGADRAGRSRADRPPSRSVRGRDPARRPPGRHGDRPRCAPRASRNNAGDRPSPAGTWPGAAHDGAALRRRVRRRPAGRGEPAASPGDLRARAPARVGQHSRPGLTWAAAGQARLFGAPCAARIAWTTDSRSPNSVRRSPRAAASMSSSLAIWSSVALSADEIELSAAAARKQARSSCRRCAASEIRSNSRVTR